MVMPISALRGRQPRGLIVEYRYTFHVRNNAVWESVGVKKRPKLSPRPFKGRSVKNG